MLEKQVKDKIKARLKQYGIYFFMPVPMNNRGVPDFICCVKGSFVAIETKSDKGRLTHHQKQHLDKILDNQGDAYVVHPSTLDDMLERIDGWGK